MKSMGSILFAAALLAAVPHVSEAQQPEVRRGGPPQHEMTGRFFEAHRAELGLNDAQVAQLDQVAARLKERNGPLREQMRAAMPQRERGERRQHTDEERGEMRARREALRPVMEQMRVNRRQAMEESRAVLTPEQRDKLQTLMKENRHERQERSPGRHRRQHQG